MATPSSKQLHPSQFPILYSLLCLLKFRPCSKHFTTLWHGPIRQPPWWWDPSTKKKLLWETGMSGGHIINLSAPRTAAMCKKISAAIVENHWLRAVRNKLLTDGWLNMQRNTPEDLTCDQQIQRRPFLNPTGKSVGNSFHSLWSSYLQNTSTSYSFRLPEFVRGKDSQRKASTTSHARVLNPHKNYFPCTPKNGYLS